MLFQSIDFSIFFVIVFFFVLVCICEVSEKAKLIVIDLKLHILWMVELEVFISNIL